MAGLSTVHYGTGGAFCPIQNLGWGGDADSYNYIGRQEALILSPQQHGTTMAVRISAAKVREGEG